MNRDELRQAIERKTAEVNSALNALNDLVGQATKAGLIVSVSLADAPGQSKLKSVKVKISDRIEVPMQQPPR
jgi:hypothetical protein